MCGARFLVEHRRNLLLRSLQEADFQLIAPHLTLEPIAARQVLCEIGDDVENVWFVQSGVVSLINVLADGSAVECCTVGPEGGVGLLAGLRRGPALTRQICQIEGVASRVRASVFHELCARHASFADLAARQVAAIEAVLVQSIACYAHHALEGRLARWLLTTADHVQDDAFPVTQEMLAVMLGVQRPTVSLSAGELQQRGLIRISRGKVAIEDREGLKRRACECYGVLRERLQGLLRGPAAAAPAAVGQA